MAAALAAATASPAAGMASPGCSTRVVLADVGASATCGFDSPYDYTLLTVVPSGTVTAATRCVTPWYTYTSSRTVSETTRWTTYTPAYCTLTLTSESAGASANASATPWVRPIIEPYPYPTP